MKDIKEEVMSLDLINRIITTGKVPDKYNFKSDDYQNVFFYESIKEEFNLRHLYTTKISWCLVNNLWIKELADILKDGKCLEIYGGKGLISHRLKEEGIDITCTDIKKFYGMDYDTTFTDVLEMDAVSAIKSFPKDSLDFIIASWIPYEDTECVEVCKTILKYQKNCKFVHIGESWGGCCARDEFFEYMNGIPEYEERLYEINDKYFQQWYGIHDEIEIFTVKDC
jgi:hypothetical protein